MTDVKSTVFTGNMAINPVASVGGNDVSLSNITNLEVNDNYVELTGLLSTAYDDNDVYDLQDIVQGKPFELTFSYVSNSSSLAVKYSMTGEHRVLGLTLPSNQEAGAVSLTVRFVLENNEPVIYKQPTATV